MSSTVAFSYRVSVYDIGHMTNMAAVCIYGKNPLKPFPPESVGRFQLNLA